MDHVAPASATQRTATVLDNVQLARDTYLIRLDAPELAEDIRPGQFVMIRPGSGTEPLLGRPFALYDVTGTPPAIEIVYQVVGKGTAALARARSAQNLQIWGPLGNGFGPPPGGPVVFVAGGIGQTPFLALGRWWTGQETYGRVRFASPDAAMNADPSLNEPGTVVKTPVATSATLLYGVRSAEYLAGLEDFRRNGIAVEVATDDGSAGHHGFVTDLLEQRLARGERPAKVVGCGPPAMLASLTRLANRYDVPCDLSLENHMACGFGACFSCVAPIRQGDGSTDLRRVCVEGPVFNAQDVVWS